MHASEVINALLDKVPPGVVIRFGVKGEDLSISKEWLYQLQSRVESDLNSIHLVMTPLRAGSVLYSHHLEFRYFHPQSPQQEEFEVRWVKWKMAEKMPALPWQIVTLPAVKKQLCIEAAKATRMRLSQPGSIPHCLGFDGKQIEVKKFPVSGPNVFTLEHGDDFPRHVSAEKFFEWEYNTCDQVTDGDFSFVDNFYEE